MQSERHLVLWVSKTLAGLRAPILDLAWYFGPVVPVEGKFGAHEVEVNALPADRLKRFAELLLPEKEQLVRTVPVKLKWWVFRLPAPRGGVWREAERVSALLVRQFFGFRFWKVKKSFFSGQRLEAERGSVLKGVGFELHNYNKLNFFCVTVR